MIRGCLAIALICGIGLAALSCGDPQELVSITIQPGTETFGAANIPVIEDAGAQVQLTAYGNYIHPPVTKNITNAVTWTSDTPQMVTVTSGGLITVTGGPCGGTIITASVTTNSDNSGVSSTGAVVTGTMTANVVCFTGAGPLVTVDFAGTGSGTISSQPLGLGCSGSAGSTCSGSFPTGTTVTLTATPNGGTFGGWTGCTINNGTSCTIDDLTNNVTVTATFN